MKKMKNGKFISRFLSLLLTLVMVVTMLPATAKADTTSDSTDDADANSGLVVNKTATLEDDGTYTINLEAYATGETTTVTEKSGKPLDIVLVIDQSGSMVKNVENLKTAVGNFVKQISDNAKDYNVDHKVALVGYASDHKTGGSNKTTGSSYNGDKDYWVNTGLYVDGNFYNYKTNASDSSEGTELENSYYQDALVSVYDKNQEDGVSSSVKQSISMIKASGATYTEYGMKMANKIFENNPIEETERKRIVVVFTDGAPGKTGYDSTVASDAVGEAYTTKNTYDAKVYTVGLYSDPSIDVTNFMNYLSSNYPSATSMDTTYKEVYSTDSDFSTTNTYYKKDVNGEYTEIKCYDGKWKTSENSWFSYTPKTSSNDTDGQHTQFYKKVTVTKEDTKYYMTTSNSTELTKIFENISADIQHPTSNVTLDANAVMKDILGNEFVFPSGFTVADNVTIYTQSGSVTDGANITWETKTKVDDDSITASANITDKTIAVTGFDYSTKYIAPSHNGEKLIVEIKGIEATDAAITGKAIATNSALSGIYANKDAEDVVKAFPQPKTILTSKTYVLDYGKKVELTTTDWGQTAVKNLRSNLSKISGDDVTALNYGTVANTTSKVTYTPNKINWDGYDSFYALGTPTETYNGVDANKNNIWSKVNVIPANSVYYEDDFMSTSNSKDSGVTIQYSDDWTTESDNNQKGSDTQSSDNNRYGYDASHDDADDVKYSGGSAHFVTGAGTASTAKFTFTGTGVDIYSRTDMETGLVRAVLYKHELETDGTTKYVKKKTLDVDQLWSSAETYGELYQIPTLFFKGYEYGTYTVEIMVANGDTTGGRKNYYLDGIRVYEPIKELEATDNVVSDAYDEATESSSFIQSVRDILLPGGMADEASGKIDGAVFIDKLSGNTTELATYRDFGPKNEVYLQAGQSVAFKISAARTDKSKVYVGLKAPQGKGATVKVTDGQTTVIAQVKSASDLYYEVTPDAEGNVVIKNEGENLLAVTNVRVTGVDTTSAALVYTPQLSSYIAKFDTLGDNTAVVSEDGSSKVTIENVTETQTVPDTTEEEAVWLSLRTSAATWLNEQK